MRELLHRRYVLFPLIAVVLALATLVEVRTSAVQALVLSRAAAWLTYRVEAGPSKAIRFPRTGPYDERLGYTRLAGFVERLEGAGYRVERQARLSPGLDRLAAWGVALPYREKTRAGLAVLDREEKPLYATRYPEAGLRALRGGADAPRQHRALHREPRAPRRGPSLPQSGGGLAAARQGGRGRGARAPGRRAALHRREHAAHPAREAPALAGRAHALARATSCTR